jgi:glucokinase
MSDPKNILTLDAGGTNFVFSAMRDFEQVVDPIRLPAHADDLERSLQTLNEGFKQVKKQLDGEADAISFAFPGPANYALGIIENLPNFPAYNGMLPLKDILQEQFKMPVFINNDGDLFAYGEAKSGLLPEVNKRLREHGSEKQYKNLTGLTLGTGFGAGIVIDGVLLGGDNSCGAGIHDTLNALNPEWNIEDSVSTRAILREYAAASGEDVSDKMPLDIYEIAKERKTGDPKAATYSFTLFGAALGHAIANISTLIDGMVVIGGGLSESWDLFAPELFRVLRMPYKKADGAKPGPGRLSVDVYDLENEMDDFLAVNPVTIPVPGSTITVSYDRSPRIGVGRSRLGASHAISIGAYAFAVQQLNR